MCSDLGSRPVRIVCFGADANERLRGQHLIRFEEILELQSSSSWFVSVFSSSGEAVRPRTPRRRREDVLEESWRSPGGVLGGFLSCFPSRRASPTAPSRRRFLLPLPLSFPSSLPVFLFLRRYADSQEEAKIFVPYLHQQLCLSRPVLPVLPVLPAQCFIGSKCFINS